MAEKVSALICNGNIENCQKMSKRTPRLWLNVWNNFIASFKPRSFRGTLIGSDYLGNKYYEIPASQSNRGRPSRWFQNAQGEEGFDNEMPAEWESWLRLRRREPPTEEEILKNLAIIKMKQKNAAELERKFGKGETTKPIKGMESFPKYEEFSTKPKE